jgi:hypothetical protein
MANDLTALTPEVWNRKLQMYIKKSAIFMAIASLNSEVSLSA